MKMMKKRWVKIVGFALAVVVCACLVFLFLAYRRVKNSILGEMGIKHVIEQNEVFFYELDLSALKALDREDRRQLLWILSHTRKYDKEKDQPFLLKGYFLPDPYIAFRKKGVNAPGHSIDWNYTEATFRYSPPGTPETKGPKYYLDEKYAQELKDLFDKYINFPIRNY